MQIEKHLNSKQKYLFWRLVFQVSVLLLLIFSLLWQLKSVDWGQLQKMELTNDIFLGIAIFLLPVNLYFEWLKWKLVAGSSARSNDQLLAFSAGIGASFLTPNGWGSFIGRMQFYPKRMWVRIIIGSSFGNFTQFFATVIFALFGSFLFIDFAFLRIPLFVILAFCSFLFSKLIYLQWLSTSTWKKRILNELLFLNKLKFKMLLFSLLRYTVFLIQFSLLFLSFETKDFLRVASGITCVYAFTSVIPSLWSGKLLIRETASLFVMTKLGFQESTILVSCLLIWLINHVFPAILSSFVWLKFKK